MITGITVMMSNVYSNTFSMFALIIQYKVLLALGKAVKMKMSCRLTFSTYMMSDQMVCSMYNIGYNLLPKYGFPKRFQGQWQAV